MNPEFGDTRRIDFSVLRLGRRDALVAAVLARCRYRPPDLWSALVDQRRSVVRLALAAVIVSTFSMVATRTVRASTTRTGAGLPGPIAWLVASPTTPSPRDVVTAMAELPR